MRISHQVKHPKRTQARDKNKYKKQQHHSTLSPRKATNLLAREDAAHAQHRVQREIGAHHAPVGELRAKQQGGCVQGSCSAHHNLGLYKERPVTVKYMR
jgi:hypothetical protein